VARTVLDWPVVRQVRERRMTGDDDVVASGRTESLRPSTDGATMTQSICPYCGVGCGQRIYSRGGRVVHVEGDPDSPISRGRLCPKGAATRGLVQSPTREQRVKYRPPHASSWQELDLDVAMDMIADRVIETRSRTWQERDPDGNTLKRTMGFGSLGGATLDNEENYLIKKLFTALGAIQIENQARI
jgi:formate dehydrogenase major subunit